MKQIAWSGKNNDSNRARVFGGGVLGSPAKQYFTTSHKTVFKP
jgi:hypothetical protein